MEFILKHELQQYHRLRAIWYEYELKLTRGILFL